MKGMTARCGFDKSTAIVKMLTKRLPLFLLIEEAQRDF